MAEKFGSDRSTNDLIAKAAHSRDRVERDLRGLHYELDFQRKLRKSFREHISLWLTISTAVGVLIVLLPTRKKKIYVGTHSNEKTNKKLAKNGVALGALNIAASLIRPAIAEVVKNRLTHHVSGRWTRER